MLSLIRYESVKKYRVFMAVVVTTILASIFMSLKFGKGGLAGFLLQ